MNVLLANPRGFCAGVDRAIEIVDRALKLFGAPIYVRHEVVHNRFVVDSLRSRGAIFVDEIHEVPDNNTVIFSAHGVSQTVQTEAEERTLQVFDATCPLVTKVHMEVARHCRHGRNVILIGHKGHPEVEGTMGRYSCPEQKADIFLIETAQDVEDLAIDENQALAYVTQTTLSVDDTQKVISALYKRYPHIKGPKKDDICYATQNRQDAVKLLAAECDMVLVVGSPNSSNSNRLRELSENQGTEAYLIDRSDDIQESWLNGVNTIGVTAGASAPDILVDEVIDTLKNLGANKVTDLEGTNESMFFSLPPELRVIETS